MITETAEGLAASGISTFLIDLFGTGDSGGDFSDADWASWLKDIEAAAVWLNRRRLSLRGILAVRLGCALAVEAVQKACLPRVDTTVLWQPVFQGSRFLNQFLRLRIAASLMSGDRKETLAGLRDRLREGEVLEVAGYGLSGRLAFALDNIEPADRLPDELGDVHWMEVSRDREAVAPRSIAGLLEATRAAGRDPDLSTHTGEPFWSSTETVVLGSMVSESIHAFEPRNSAQSTVEPSMGF